LVYRHHDRRDQFDHWHTRSTVGYYVKKFRCKHGKEYKPTPITEVKKSKDEIILAGRIIQEFLLQMLKLIKQGKYREAVDLQEAYFAYKRLCGELCRTIQGEDDITASDLVNNFRLFNVEIFDKS
jgi:hypothetical protein